jgi:hypothetical protein
MSTWVNSAKQDGKSHTPRLGDRSSVRRSQSAPKGHTISSSISLIFCTVVMIALRNKAEIELLALTFPPSPFPLCCSNDEDGDTITLSPAFSPIQPHLALFRSVLRWSDYPGQSLSSAAANKPTFYPFSPWVVRKVQSGSGRPSQTTRYTQRQVRPPTGPNTAQLV